VASIAGFEMIAEVSVYEVVVTDETELDGFNDLSELEIGDEVEARGLLQGTTLIASRVKLRSSGEEARLRGVIVAFTADGFELESDGTVFQVVVTPETELHNFSSLAELAVGDEIEARGSLSGLVLTATRLELLEGGVDFEYKGLLTMLLPPDRFVMDDGRIYTVDQSTFYDPTLGGYSGLAVGQYLEVEARRAHRAPTSLSRSMQGRCAGRATASSRRGPVDQLDRLQLEGRLRFDHPATEFDGDADS
jgi:hypothetical protein